MIFRTLILYFFFGLSVVAFADVTDAPPDGIQIDPQDQTCSSNEDCVIIETKCKSNGCECGVPVNKDRFAVYKKQLDECRSKQGMMAMCDFLCPTPYPSCVDGTCVLSPQPSVRK